MVLRAMSEDRRGKGMYNVSTQWSISKFSASLICTTQQRDQFLRQRRNKYLYKSFTSLTQCIGVTSSVLTC